ncbi:MAG TPA: (2Fe-2S)-binding protein [Candidatus Limnocylindria bacterium]|jgi:aerobic-type carbon monoxide dehydrogenase small subunit (CoxS/CutS family)|nr:(2Fe-2S)-binding protein [Candidatus Limnocylindria bacterium]
MLRVNGERRSVHVTPSDTLLHVLRDQLRLTGAKESCGRGECGTCTVLLDGVPVMSCVQLASLVRGEITTIEGLAEEARDLREAFADAGAFQCGFCTPGQIVRASALLREAPNPDERTVREQMSGNVCRCTGYTQIVDAVLTTARTRAARRADDAVAVGGGES